MTYNVMTFGACNHMIISTVPALYSCSYDCDHGVLLGGCLNHHGESIAISYTNSKRVSKYLIP